MRSLAIYCLITILKWSAKPPDHSYKYFNLKQLQSINLMLFLSLDFIDQVKLCFAVCLFNKLTLISAQKTARHSTHGFNRSHYIGPVTGLLIDLMSLITNFSNFFAFHFGMIQMSAFD